MADFEAPSFSLGLDLETQSEARNPTRSTFDPPRQDDSSDNAGVRANSPDEVRQEEAMDSDPEPGPEPTRVLKRLRRGVVRPAPALTNPVSSPVKTQELERSSCDGNGDDDIEDFWQEDLFVRGKNGKLKKKIHFYILLNWVSFIYVFICYKFKMRYLIYVYGDL